MSQFTVVAEGAVTRMLNSGVRRGLVLAGGGALGSYQCGALLAFEEASIQFEAVAGTSVGGLNAAIWSFGRLREGHEFWAEIDYDKVYPARGRLMKFLSGRLRHRVLFAVLVVNIVLSSLLGRALPQQLLKSMRPLATASAALVASLFSAMALLTLAVNDDRDVLGLALWISMMWIMVFIVIRNWQLKEDRSSEGMAFFRFAVGLGMMLLMQIVGIAIVPRLALYLLPFPVIAILLVLFHRATMLKSDALGHAVRAILGDGCPGIPTYVTVARSTTVYDPSSGGYKRMAPILGPGGTDLSDATVEYAPITEQRWIPEYIKLGRNPESVTKSLLATAALPFGVVPSVKIGAKSYVDGGVRDNVPVGPLLRHDLDEIYVVLLDEVGNREEFENDLRKSIACALRDAMLEARALPPNVKAKMSTLDAILSRTQALKEYEGIKPQEYFLPKLPKLQVFHPEKPAKGFADGLLRFEAEFCRQQIVKGLEETRRRLALLDLAAVGKT